MRSFLAIWLYRVAFVGTILATLFSFHLFPTVAEAAVVGCRADPIVTLSDGTTIDVTVDIATNVANVTHIHYRIHGPRHVWLISAISMPTVGFTGRETFEYINDAPEGQYITETVVETTINQVSVTAYTTFASALAGGRVTQSLAYHPVTGVNGEILRTLITR